MDNDLINEINRLSRKRELDFLRGQEEIYVLYNRDTGAKFPAIDKNGFATVCTCRDYAQKILERNSDLALEIRAFRTEEFHSYVKEWYRLGVVKFRLNPGTEDHCMEITRDEYLPDSHAKMWDYAGSSLNSYTLRYQQRKGVEYASGQAEAKTLWSMICHVLPKSLLLVPFSYAGEAEPAADAVVHVTAEAAQALEKLGRPVGPDCQGLFYGGSGYDFQTEPAEEHRAMCLRTIAEEKTGLVTAFTDFQALEQMWGGKCRVGLFTYEALRRYVPGGDGTFGGIVVNPGDTNLVLHARDLDTIDEEKGESPKIFVDLTGTNRPAPRPKAEPVEEAEETPPIPQDDAEIDPSDVAPEQAEKSTDLPKWLNFVRNALPVVGLCFGAMSVVELGDVGTQSLAITLCAGSLIFNRGRKGWVTALCGAGLALGAAGCYLQVRMGGKLLETLVGLACTGILSAVGFVLGKTVKRD